MLKSPLLIGLLTIMATLGGCGSPVKQGPTLAQVQQAQAQQQTVIGPLDTIDIRFLRQSDFNESVTVPPDGSIYLPMAASKVQAAGRTPDQLAGEIKQSYASVMRDPIVDVQIRNYANMRAFVGGEVLTPGMQQMNGQLTLINAIMAAGGFKPTARSEEVVVVRRLSDTKTESFTVNVDDIISGKNNNGNITLQPLDVVFVPRTDAANIAVAMDQYFRNLLPVPTSAGVSAAYNINPYTQTTNTTTTGAAAAAGVP